MAGPGVAQAARVALVIGNATYQHESTLRNPINDARLIETTLRQSLRFDQVITLHNGNRAQMLQELARFKRQAQGAELALVYYSGHGMISSKRQNHLLPVDMPKISANASLDADTALDIAAITEDKLLDAVEGAKVQVVILDACRDNGFATHRSGTKGLARKADQTRNRLIAYATEEGRVAEDGNGANSSYAQSLARHLVRTDWPLLKVFDEVATDVETQTKGQQSPTRTGNLRTDVYLLATVRVEPVVVPLAPPAVPATSTPVQPNPQAGRTFKDCDLCPEMVVIPAGSFTMGSDEAYDDEKPPHRVNVQAFAISRTEVTQAQWTAVMGSNPSRFSSCGDDCPMENVSWNDIQEFIRRVNQQTGKTYRLPSESEWEYAARAGSSTRYSFGDSSSQLGDYAWHEANSGGKTQRTGQKRPNSFGLHDMHGNVREWVQDCWEGNYRGAPTDGSAWTRSCAQDRRVVRGGSWNDFHPSIFRSTTRASHLADARNSHVGFRLVRSPN